MENYTATYSPEDNKLRLYAVTRLSPELYEQVKSHGFNWAPKQELFVAPMWTPSREDFLIELAGEIGDEDTTLVERAEAKAERLEDLSERKDAQAQALYDSSSEIAERFWGGQPILVGHHSEKRARKDQERIHAKMHKAVANWKEAKYWKERAAGAVRLAKYKELPAVRYRRIKGLEADQRKQEKDRQESDTALRLWTKCEALENKDLQRAMALKIAGSFQLRMNRKEGDRKDWNYTPTAYDALTGSSPTLYAPRTIEEVFAAAQRVYPKAIAYRQRWIDHYSNRIAYEVAMLDESGGIPAQDMVLKVGGRVLCGGEWSTIIRLNKKGNQIVSVTTNARYCRVKSLEEISEFETPTVEQMQAAKAVTKLAPMCNYPTEGCREYTKAQWEGKYKDSKGSKTIAATATAAAHRLRYEWGMRGSFVFLTDVKRVDPPQAELIKPKPAPEIQPAHRDAMSVKPYKPTTDPSADKVEKLQAALKAGVKVIVVPQLFPTPPELARRMAHLAEDGRGTLGGQRVLEPSAGTGNLLRAIFGSATGADNVRVVAVEHNAALVRELEEQRQKTVGAYPENFEIIAGDFLEQNGNLGTFHAVLMNPPFLNADDIKHIEHARHFLKPGGILVAICAGGPRQESALKPIAELWEPLPAGTFKEQGTNVNTVLLTIRGGE